MANQKRANAKKKKGGSKKHRKHNSASASASSSKANPKTRKKNSKKKHYARRRNPFDVAGLNLMELGAAALAAIGSQATVTAITDPTSYLGIGIGLGLAVLAAKFVPRSVRGAAVLGAGVPPVVNVINRLTNNAIGTSITSNIQRFFPTAAPQNTNMSGMVRVPDRSAIYGKPGFGGLVDLRPNSPVANRVS